MTVITIALVTTAPGGLPQLNSEPKPMRIMRRSIVVSPWRSLISMRQCDPRFRIDGINVLASVHCVHRRTQDHIPWLPVHSQLYDHANEDCLRIHDHLALTEPVISSSGCPSFKLAGITYPGTLVIVDIIVATVLRDIEKSWI